MFELNGQILQLGYGAFERYPLGRRLCRLCGLRQYKAQAKRRIRVQL